MIDRYFKPSNLNIVSLWLYISYFVYLSPGIASVVVGHPFDTLKVRVPCVFSSNFPSVLDFEELNFRNGIKLYYDCSISCHYNFSVSFWQRWLWPSLFKKTFDLFGRPLQVRLQTHNTSLRECLRELGKESVGLFILFAHYFSSDLFIRIV